MNLCSEPECDRQSRANGVCHKHYQRMQYRLGRARRTPSVVGLPVLDGSKVCGTCGEEKQLSEFSRHGSNSDGHRRNCRKCVCINGREWRKQNTRRVKATTLKRHYGISIEDHERMLAEQLGACAICRAPEDQTMVCLAVDHDHVTGKVRGLLCRGCNTGLGNFSDDPSRMSSAIKYLLKGRD